MTSIHDFRALNEHCRAQQIDRHRLRLLRNAFYKNWASPQETLEHLPAAEREAFGAAFALHELELVSRHDSQLDGASKLIFRTAAGYLLEAVILRIASGRTTLCVSSQVGCAARCVFCATGKMGIAHNLTYSEILDQVVQAGRLLKAEGRALRNVVFMGMGEPLHNEEHVYPAIEILCSTHCFNLSPRHVLLSTVGIPQALVRCAERFNGLCLAISLHSARQEVRQQIVPIARKHRLCELRDAMRQVASEQRPLMVEYLMLEGVNDGPQDLSALVDYLEGIPVSINLIPYNPIDEAEGLQGTSRERRLWFAGRLRAAGFRVNIRYSLGADVAAACGQLVRHENRRTVHVSEGA